MMWNPIQHTDEKNLRWCWLRAVEWGRWPLFVSQLFAPLLLLFVPWPYVVIGFFVANLLWAFVRYQFVNTGLANAVVDSMMLKWPVTIGASVFLAWQHNWPIAVLAFLWPLAATLLGIVTPTQVGRIQSLMMCQLGYERTKVFEQQSEDDG